MPPRTNWSDEEPSPRTESTDVSGSDDGHDAEADGGHDAEADDGTGRLPRGLTRRTVLKSAAATTTAATMTAAASNAAGAEEPPLADTDSAEETPLADRRGANYIPTKDFTMYQVWANYENRIVERDLDYAADLGLNSLRVWASYYHWREDGPEFFAHVEHFLAECDERGIQPIVVLFEAPGNEPTRENRTQDEGFATHSPSRSRILFWRNWDGWARSPRHFTRRWAQEFSCDPRLLATEIMNEPGKPDGAPKRVDFANEMLDEVVRESPGDPTLTMGTRTVDHVEHYDGENFDGPLDIHQFHHNLPVDENHMRDNLQKVQNHRSRAGKPVYCTEWQRTREEAPNRFQPNLKSLASTMRAAHDEFDLDGDYFWQLMLKRAYLEPPRRQGRYNGLFREDGKPFDMGDYHALKGDGSRLPDSWQNDPHSYPERGF